jgi:hypothetical protein
MNVPRAVARPGSQLIPSAIVATTAFGPVSITDTDTHSQQPAGQ